MRRPGVEVVVKARTLKRDLFGRIRQLEVDGVSCIERDTTVTRWWVRPLARLLASREARVLRRLDAAGSFPGRERLPTLLSWERGVLRRSYVAGAPLQEVRPRGPAFHRRARRLLVQLHRCGIVHNDLAKEPNLLVLPDGEAGLVDFQLSASFRRRHALFRLCAREDLRHLLKHKRTYCREALSDREWKILRTPSYFSRIWRRTVLRCYNLVTRRWLRAADREGRGWLGESRR